MIEKSLYSLKCKFKLLLVGQLDSLLLMMTFPRSYLGRSEGHTQLPQVQVATGGYTFALMRGHLGEFVLNTTRDVEKMLECLAVEGFGTLNEAQKLWQMPQQCFETVVTGTWFINDVMLNVDKRNIENRQLITNPAQ